MKVAIVGSRNVGSVSLERIFSHLPRPCSQIISGGARGIDSLAEALALEKGIPFIKIEPDYDFFGKQAPLVRNTQIVKRADTVLAFWDYKSRGTAHTISECIRLGVPIEIISLKDE